MAIKPFRGQADVLDVREIHQLGAELLQRGDGCVGNVAAAHHNVAHGRRHAQIIQHLLVTILLRNLKLELHNQRHIVPYQIHARAVSAILRAS